EMEFEIETGQRGSQVCIYNSHRYRHIRNNKKGSGSWHCINKESSAIDIAAASIIYKIRSRQSNADMDIFCSMINSLNVPNSSFSWKSIKAITKLDVRSGWSSCQICNQCGNLIHDMKLELCKECDCDNLLEFYYYSLAEQLQHILLIPTMYDQMTKQREQNEEKLRVTTYADILMDEPDTSFTMTINADGIVSKNQHVALWPVMFMLNEIPLPTRRYSESIVLVGVIPAKKHPSNKSFETILNIVSEQCKQLESGISYFIPGHGEKTLKFFLIAACSDKPAQSLLQNTVAYNANYGCARCFIQGEVFSGSNKNGKHFNIKVFPYGKYDQRNSHVCEKLVDEIEDNQMPVYGHRGRCPLTQLKYFNYGESFLFDTLHTLYLGIFKQMCLLLFSKAKEHRCQNWSLFKKINAIEYGLKSIKIPTTTSRRFRSMKHIARLKANEYRSLMHQGSTVLLNAMTPKYRRHFALLLSVINIASKDNICYDDLQLIESLSNQFVKQWQEIFGLRNMSSNIHSLLHLHETVGFIGPLYIHDVESMTHGATHYGQQLISHMQYYRQAIIESLRPDYPLKLLLLNERMLNHKFTMSDDIRVSKEIPADFYIREQEQLKIMSTQTFIFHHKLAVKHLHFKTISATT
ncbi:unnamed protein product, partial [Didymodactylos carnosus]